LERIRADQLDEAVFERIKELGRDSKLLNKIALESQKTMRNRVPDVQDLYLQKQKELAEIKGRVSNLSDRIANLPISVSANDLIEKLNELGLKKEGLQKELSRLGEQRSEFQRNNVIDLDSARKMFSSFSKLIRSEPPIRQKRIARDVISSLKVTREKIYGEYFVEGNSGEFSFDTPTELNKENSRGISSSAASSISYLSDYSRTMVRSNNQMVEAPGIEPGSRSHPSKGGYMLSRLF
jgi:hypothetical protein